MHDAPLSEPESDEMDTEAFDRMTIALMGASPTDETAMGLLDRQPVVQRSIRLRNTYVDPINAIQIELLRRFRAGDEDARVPLLRSISNIAAALRNTG